MFVLGERCDLLRIGLDPLPDLPLHLGWECGNLRRDRQHLRPQDLDL
jgi:hypothetical protein